MLRVKDITLIAILTAILFAQEQILSFLPNIQLTVLLIVLYSKVLGLKKTIIIVTIHTFLDNLLMGFNIFYFPFMLIGWLIIPISLNTIFKRVNNTILLAFLGILFSFLYSWLFVFANVILLQVGFWQYLIADLYFEILLAASSFFTILWLYDPLYKLMIEFQY